MTTQSALIGLMLSALAGSAGAAPLAATQSPGPDSGYETARFAVAGPATEDWVMTVSTADGQVSYTRRSTHQGSVARVTSIVIGTLQPGAVEAGMPADSLAQLVLDEQVTTDRTQARATGDYKLADVQTSDTMIGQRKVHVLRYRRVMTSWKSAGWVEAMTVYLFFAPDFPEQHRLVRVQVSQRFQVRSVGNEAPDDSATVLSVIQRLQGEASGLSLRSGQRRGFLADLPPLIR